MASATVQGTSVTAQTTSRTRVYDDKKYLRSVITPDSSGKVNEEQLFAAIVEERVKATFGATLALKFRSYFDSAKKEIGNRANMIENAARRGLRALVKAGSISEREAITIHSHAFAAAQIDKNLGALYDGTGGKGDTTIATELVDSAVSRAIKLLNSFDSGKVNPKEVALKDI